MILQEKEFEITNKDLQESFPELYEKYKETFGSKRPDISVEIQDEYNFHVSVTDWQSDYWNPVIYFFLHDGKVAYFDAGVDGGKGNFPFGKYKLGDSDAILECYTKSFNRCNLIVNSHFINKQALPVSEDLDFAEEYVLCLMHMYKAAFRRKNFLSYIYDGNYTVDNWKRPIKEVKKAVLQYGNYKDEAYDAILLSLQMKDLVVINSAGSSRLTNKGTNIAIQLNGR